GAAGRCRLDRSPARPRRGAGPAGGAGDEGVGGRHQAAASPRRRGRRAPAAFRRAVGCPAAGARRRRLSYASAMSLTSEDVFEALRVVEDPELGMDVVDLGLVYDVIIDGADVKVIYSLTSMGCPAGQQIQEQIQDVAASIEGVENVSTELTFTPPWTPEMMSDDAKFVLGF